MIDELLKKVCSEETIENIKVKKYILGVELKAMLLPNNFKKLDFYFSNRRWDKMWDKNPHFKIESIYKMQTYFNERMNEVAESLGIEKRPYACEICDAEYCQEPLRGD